MRTRHLSIAGAAAVALLLSSVAATAAPAHDPTSTHDRPRCITKQVTVKIDGPSVVTVGVPVKYTVTIIPHSVLHNAVLLRSLADGEHNSKLGTLKKGKTYRRTFTTTYRTATTGTERGPGTFRLTSSDRVPYNPRNGCQVWYYDRFGVTVNAA